MKSNIFFLLLFASLISLLPIAPSKRVESATPSLFSALHYDIEIRIILDPNEKAGQQYTAPGKARIIGKTKTNLSTLWLHVNQLEINESSIKVLLLQNDKHQQPPILVNISHLTKTEVGDVDVGIHLEKEIEEEQMIAIYIDYVIKLHETNWYDNEGLIYEGLNNTKMVAFIAPYSQLPGTKSKWHPMFPCLDGVAIFNVTVIRKENYYSIFNTKMLTSAKDPNYEGWVMDSFSRTLIMQPEMVSLAVIPNTFTVAESYSKLNNKTIRIHAQLSVMKKGDPSYALNAAGELVDFYDNFFNKTETSSFEKLDFVLIPGALRWEWGDGIEKNICGIVYIQENFYNEHILLKFENFEGYAINWSTEYSIHDTWPVTMIGEVVSSKIVRQYLGSSGDKMDLYPDLLDYLNYLGMESLYSTTEFASKMKQDYYMNSLLVNLKEFHNFENFPDLLYDLKQEKGLYPLKMLEGFLTKEVVVNGLKSFAEKVGKNEVVRDQDFFEILQKEHEKIMDFDKNLNISLIMQSWMKLRGHPVVKAEVVGNGTQILLTQERFVDTEKESEDHRQGMEKWDQETWQIPIFIVTQDDPSIQEIVWLQNKTLLLEHNASSSWIILNNDAVGQYRVLYDEQLLHGISEQLERNASILSPLSRAKLMHDHIMFEKRNYTSIETILILTQYLGQETEYGVWDSLFKYPFKGVNQLFPSLPKYEPIQTYLYQRYDSALLRNEAEKNNTKTYLDIGLDIPSFRTTLGAYLLQKICTEGFPSPLCSLYGQELVESWKAEINNNSFLFSGRSKQYLSISCGAVAMAQGGNESFHVLLRYYETLSKKNGSSKKEREEVLRLLTCTQDPELVQKLIDGILDDKSQIWAQKGDADYLLTALIQKRGRMEARAPVWNLLKTDKESVLRVVAQVPENKLGYKFDWRTKYNTKSELKLIADIISENEDLFGDSARYVHRYVNTQLADDLESKADRFLNFVMQNRP